VIGRLIIAALTIASFACSRSETGTPPPVAGNGDRAASQQRAVTPQAMLDMTLPEFEAAAAKTDAALLPIGSIEEHGPHLPLASDSILAVAQLIDVQRYLHDGGIETIVGPTLNIGITNEAGDWTRDGTYMYPGSLTISTDRFVGLYVDLLHSLHDNGLRRVFLYSGHLGGRHIKAMARIAEEANRTLKGLKAYALIDSERVEQVGLQSGPALLRIERGLNFEMLTELLGRGAETAASTHADGWETSLMLHYRPDMVRPGYQNLPEAPSSRFFEAIGSGDRTKNPSGMGGLPLARASAAAGKTIADYRTRRIGDAIMRATK